MVSELIKGVNKNKIEVIYNGVKKSDYKKSYQKINLPNIEGKTILGYIGTHGMAHNLDFIVKCAANYQDQQPSFSLLGMDLIKQFKKSIERNNVTFIGNIPSKFHHTTI